MDVGKVAAPDGMIDSRREALKQFARYAAAAPTTMVLLQPAKSCWPQEKGQEAQKKAAGTTDRGNSRAPS